MDVESLTIQQQQRNTPSSQDLKVCSSNLSMEETTAENGIGVLGLDREELKGIEGLKMGKGYMEMKVGCTSLKYGDAVGTLRISSAGTFLIACDCTPGCDETSLTPAAFERHAGNRSKKWKSNIWVIRDSVKVPLSRSGLLDLHDPGPRRPRARRNVHRDEFVRCADCGKVRRFKRRDRDECRAYHNAQKDPNWRCGDFHGCACDAEEERASSRRALRGCPSSFSACAGCASCVCLGCPACRFDDCPCRDCLDYFALNNAASQ